MTAAESADRHTHCEENDSGGKDQEVRCEQEPNPADESVKKMIRVAQPHPLVQEIPLNPPGSAARGLFPAGRALQETALFERLNELI